MYSNREEELRFLLSSFIGERFKMSTIYTIHPGVSKESYGYETSQLSRQKVAKYLGLGYRHLLTSPQLQEGYWKDLYKGFGFKEDSLVSIPNSFSDCGHEQLSLLEKDLPLQFIGSQVYKKGDFVSHVLTSDGSTWYFTSHPYLEKRNDGVLVWYNKDGSIAMKAKYFDITKEPVPVKLFSSDYLYFKDEGWLTSEDLLIKYLLGVVTKKDLLIRDQHQVPHLKLWRFVEFKGLNYYEYIHHNVLIDPASNLRKKTKYLVASELLTEELRKQGYKVSFLPPIALSSNESIVTLHDKPSKFCFVGNMSDNKRTEWVLDVFKDLYYKSNHVTLNLYGSVPEEYLISITPNVKVHGYVPNVPYSDNQVYISCSKTELFANSCVEAMYNGLYPLLSDVDFAHRYYNSCVSSCRTFKTKKELKDLIEWISGTTVRTDSGVVFASSRYSLFVVASEYLKLVGGVL